MITATRNWFKRNRTGIAIGASLLGAGYFVGQYVLSKVTEARQRMSEDRIARENLRRRFEQNQEDCTYTVLALLPTATENILKAIPCEDITRELQQQRSQRLATSAENSEIAPSDVPSATDDDGGRSLGSSSFIHTSQIAAEPETQDSGRRSQQSTQPKKSKAQLWNELKITSITRAFTLVYTLSLLTLLTRIQLNLLGRRNYLSSVVSLASPLQQGSGISLENRDDDNLEQDYGSDFETNRKYLTFSWWLLHRGWKELKERVELAVKDIFGPLGLKENITFGKLAELTLEVRKRVEGASEEERSEHKWLQYLLPPRHEEELVLRESGVLQSSSPDSVPSHAFHMISPSLRRLLDETSDLIDSPTFTHVLTLILDAAMSHLIDDKLATQAYKLPSQTQPALTPPRPEDYSATLLSSENRVQEILDDDDDVASTQDPKQASTKLATALAVFTRQAHAIGSGGNVNNGMSSDDSDMPGMSGKSIKEANEYLGVIENVRDLEAFAAVVYSSNFELESVAGVVPGRQDFSGDTTDSEQAKALTLRPPDESIVDVGAEFGQKLESAWGKAVAKDDARSSEAE